MKKISILIACYYSEKTIGSVVSSLHSMFQEQNYDNYEIILVNDGSKDGTFPVIKALAEQDSRVVGINLSKNYGQLCAKMAGMKYVTGDYLVYMDDDGQHPIEHFFELIHELDQGHDIVYAEFTEKQYGMFKKVTSDLHGKITEIVLGKPKGIKISSYYAINNTVIEALKGYDSPFPSPLGFMLQVSTDLVNVPMVQQKRLAGSSHYNLKRLLVQWLTVFTNFSLVPLRVSALIGVISAIMGLILGCVFMINKFLTNTMPGYTSIICILLFLGGLILLALGLIGEYLGRIYMTVSDKPQYVLREVVDVRKNK